MRGLIVSPAVCSAAPCPDSPGGQHDMYKHIHNETMITTKRSILQGSPLDSKWICQPPATSADVRCCGEENSTYP